MLVALLLAHGADAEDFLWCSTSARPSAMHLAAAGGHLLVARVLRACAPTPPPPPRPPMLQLSEQTTESEASLAAASETMHLGTASERDRAPAQAAATRSTEDGQTEPPQTEPPLDRARDARLLTPLQVAVKACHLRFAHESALAACQCGPARQMAGWGPGAELRIEPSQRTQGEDRRVLLDVFREAAGVWARLVGRPLFSVACCDVPLRTAVSGASEAETAPAGGDEAARQRRIEAEGLVEKAAASGWSQLSPAEQAGFEELWRTALPSLPAQEVRRGREEGLVKAV